MIFRRRFAIVLYGPVSGDKLEDLTEANPFSFKEFLKTKNLSLSGEDTANNRIYSKVDPRHHL